MSPVIFSSTPGGGLAALPQALRQAGMVLTAALPAAVLINLAHDAGAAIATAEVFADAVPPQGEALVINLLAEHALTDWPAASAAATMWAFTRHAALVWAARGIRVNALCFGACPEAVDQPRETAGRAAFAAPAGPATLADIASTVVAFCRLRSMTGQLVRLGAPA